jgi:hypothetical protein
MATGRIKYWLVHKEAVVRFEDAGRAIDREVAKLIEMLDRKVKPATRRDMAKLLRSTSARLAKLADSLEKAES